MVTARSGGVSYLNCVELQNGCLSLGHANIFIPSTLVVLALTIKQVYKIDAKKFKHNMELAIKVYLNWVNNSPCGDTNISLFEGPDSTEFQNLTEKVLLFLKSSKAKQQDLLQQKVNVFIYIAISDVWKVTNKHMKQNLPTQYIFSLIGFCADGTYKESG